MRAPRSAAAARCQGVSALPRPIVPYDRGPMRILSSCPAALTPPRPAAPRQAKVQSANAAAAPSSARCAARRCCRSRSATCGRTRPSPRRCPRCRTSRASRRYQPKTFTITVKSIDAARAPTRWSVSRRRSRTTCTKDPKKPAPRRAHRARRRSPATRRSSTSRRTASSSPASPAATRASTFDEFDRKGTSWELPNGAFGDAEWPEDIVAHWTQDPTQGIGREAQQRQARDRAPHDAVGAGVDRDEGRLVPRREDRHQDDRPRHARRRRSPRTPSPPRCRRTGSTSCGSPTATASCSP